MTYNVMIENKKVTGTAEEILTLLNSKSFFHKCNTIQEFIQKVTHDVWRLYGIGIQIKNDNPNQLIEQLLQFDLLRPAYMEGLK